jgi:2-polyprenyl-3-methyl-5-hydroxy-6-metoxy-1,4-benzoquinol methylase
VWLDPRPIAEDLPLLYSRYYTHDPPPAALKKGLKAWARRIVLAQAFGYQDGPVGAWNRAAGRLLSRFGLARDRVGASIRWISKVQTGRLLDIGCGNGEFLAAMRGLGWDVLGLEPDPMAARTAREKLGLSVEQATLEAHTLPRHTSDAVTMHHVIEHLPDPVQSLRLARELLRPGGRLIVVTPNAQSLARYLFRRHWMSWDPPRHLSLFTPRTLQATATRAGLRMERMWTTARLAMSVCEFSYQILRRGTLESLGMRRRRRRLLPIAFAVMIVEDLLLPFWPCGEEIVMVAR